MKLSLRLRRWIIALGVLAFLYTVIGFFIVPLVVKSQMLKQVATLTGRTATVGKVKVNPYAFSVTIEDFAVLEKDGKQAFVGWKRLYVNAGVLDSIFGAWVASDIELDDFHSRVVIDTQGAFNFADILKQLEAMPKPATKEPAASPGRPLMVKRLAVTQARLDFQDLSRKTPFKDDGWTRDFSLTGFKTAGAEGAPGGFEAVTEAGEKFAWKGWLAADPVSSKGELSASGIVLKKYAPYFEDLVKVDLADGLLSMKGSYELSLDPKKQVILLNGGEALLERLKVVDRQGGASLIELPRLQVSGISADAMAMKATIAKMNLADGSVKVRREKDGSINLLTLLLPPASAPAAAAAATTGAASAKAPMPMPELLLKDFALGGFAIELTDLTVPRPAVLSLTKLQVSMKDLTLADGAKMPLSVSFDWSPAGTVKVDGVCSIKPAVSAELNTQVAGLDIRPISPFIEQFVNARLTGGAVTTANQVKLSLPDSGPAIEFAGDVKVEGFALVDAKHQERLAGFGSLTLAGIKAVTSPQIAVSLSEINVAAPYADVRVQADGSINLVGLAKTPEEAAAAAAAPAKPGVEKPVLEVKRVDLPQIDIGKILITDGDFLFSDRSLAPNVATRMNQFGGSIVGLSSQNMAKADVDLKGTVDGSGPVSIVGKLDPLSAERFVDLKIDFKNVDLVVMSPYSEKFAGYELARGKLAVDSKIALKGDKLTTTNLVTLNQFTFGGPVESKDATKLPVRLGVALLKDMDGKIVIDLPVEGNLNDPSFKVGKVVMRVIVNLLTKAAVSPFSLLGSMFGGGGEELSFQEFSPGSSEFQASEKPKLETLVKALTNRPALALDIEGSYDAAADAYALKQKKLEILIRNTLWDEQHATNPNIPPPEQLVVTPEQHDAMLKKLFDAKFPPGSLEGTPLPPAPPPVVAAPARRPGFVKRVFIKIGLVSANPKPAKETQTAAAPAAATAAPGAAVPAISVAEMTARLVPTMEIADIELAALATQRAQAIRDYLTTIGKIDPARVFMSKGKDAAKKSRGPRAFMSLQ